MSQGKNVKCFKKHKGTWTDKVMKAEAGRGSLLQDKGAGHRKVFQAAVNKRQQYLPDLHSAGALLPGRCWHRQFAWRREKGRAGGGFDARNKLFPLMSTGKLGRKHSLS